jgi:hypothetical protein
LHEGRVEISDSPSGGACVSITFGARQRLR